MLTSPIVTGGTCMIIRASNVTLNLSGFGITGNGIVGDGVLIAGGFTNVQVVNGQLKAWAVGVEDLGTNTQLQNLKVFNNVQMGVAVAGGSGNRVLNNKFPGNGRISIYVGTTTNPTVTGNNITGSGKYGIWVRSSTQFTVGNNAVSQSGIAGIFVGCTAAGITNTLTCKPSAAGTIANNRVVYDRLGIAIDRGNSHILVHNNNVSLGGKFDLFDSNPSCGTNTWSSDTYKTHKPRLCAK